MEEELPSTPEGTGRSEPEGLVPSLPPELTTKEQELRRLVDAGAASPEELRALAAKLEERRAYEESLWERDVRPALMQSKKRRLSLLDLRSSNTKERSSSLLLGFLLLAGVLLLLLVATQTSVLWLLVAVLAVLVYAWVQGSRPSNNDAPAAAPPDASD